MEICHRRESETAPAIRRISNESKYIQIERKIAVVEANHAVYDNEISDDMVFFNSPKKVKKNIA